MYDQDEGEILRIDTRSLIDNVLETQLIRKLNA